uniref:Uncharacterized protein n=1 Tax=Caenorhabditis tropicalis TaxID=1561998 RepID=A0A1I7TLT1_9PELO
MEFSKGTVPYSETFQIKVIQAFWGSIDLQLEGHNNVLIFNLDDESDDCNARISMSIEFTLNSDTLNKVIVFKPEDLLQFLYTPNDSTLTQPHIIILRLQLSGFQIIQKQLPEECKQWAEVLASGKLRSHSFSDNLIFVCHPESISFNRKEPYIDKTGNWTVLTNNIIPHLKDHWSDYLRFTKQKPEQDDLGSPLDRRNFTALYSDFGLSKTISYIKYGNNLDLLKLQLGNVFGNVKIDYFLSNLQGRLR